MKIKVLHLRDTYDIGGPGKTILSTYRHIDKDIFDIEVGIFLRHNECNKNPFVLEAKRIGLKVHYIEGFNQYDLIMITRLKRLLSNNSFDIVHTHEVKSDIIGFLATRKINLPIVTTLHGWIGNDIKQKVFSYLDKKILKHFDCVITVSNKMTEELTKNKNYKNIEVVRNAIDPERYSKISNENSKKNNNIKEKKILNIASIGRLSEEKGQRDFLNAAKIVLNKGYRANFLIVGDGPDKKRLKDLLKNEKFGKHILMTGHIENIDGIYKIIDLLVLCSYTEGIPNVLLEALICRIPVFATKVGGIPEMIPNDNYGTLIQKKSPRLLSKKIIEFLKNPEKFTKKAESGYNLVCQKFNFKNRTNILQNIYLEIIKNRSLK
jgi:glycosyltransferase involved in cell wall biosynthesis